MKITTITNGIKNLEAFNTGMTQVKTLLFPLGFTFNTKQSNATYTTERFANPTIGFGYRVLPSQILSEITGQEDIAFLVFSNDNLNPKPLNPLHSNEKKGNATSCQMAEEWYNGYPEVFTQFYLHEVAHALFFKTGKVDTVHDTPNEWSQKSPTEYYLHLIKSLVQVPILTLTRKSDNGVQALGNIQGHGMYLNTLERPFKGNLTNVSAIPKGVYDVKWTFSPKFLKYTYEVQKVPKRSGIRIHSANYWYDLNGCIALGTGYTDLNKDGQADIINSRIAVKQFEDVLGRKPFKLQIL